MEAIELLPPVSAVPAGGPAPVAREDLRPQRAAQSLLAVIVYIMFAVLHEAGVVLGLVGETSARVLSTATISVGIVFYALVRTGASARFFGAGNAVVVAQCAFGLVAASWAYVIDGPMRGGCLVIFLMVMVFGMFALRPAQARGVAASGLAFLAAAAYQAWRYTPEAERPWQVETMHVLFTAVGVLTVLMLSERLSQLRALVLDQKLQLEDTLERVKEMAVRDELTGLVNRRQVLLCMESELARLERTPGELAVALIDIDHFKQVNDRYGHRAGDVVLQSFAKAASSELRGSDILARWGGEEFLLMLPTTPEAVATAAIERLRATVSEREMGGSLGVGAITFSAGVTMYKPGDTVQSLIDRADGAMYAAKAQGRNRTVRANEPDGTRARPPLALASTNALT